MPLVKDIIKAVQEKAPQEFAAEWDNVGLLVDCGGSTDKVLVALDATSEVVCEAQKLGCGLIVTHHPVIFSPIKSVSHNDVVFKLIKAGISVFCAHTNLDVADGGVNDVLCDMLEVNDRQVFADIGRTGTLKKAHTASQLGDICAKALKTNVKVSDAGKPINRVAVVGGSGGDLLRCAAESGVDCIVTGEASHHHALDAYEMGISMVVAGHYNTEFPVVSVLSEWISESFPDMQVYISEKNNDPFMHCLHT